MIGTSVGNWLIFKAKPEDGLLLSILLLKQSKFCNEHFMHNVEKCPNKL